MKTFRNIALFFTVTLLLSCNNTGNTGNQEVKPGEEGKAEALVSSEGKVIYLTKAEFLSKVFDFEKNSEWKYQGELPAIIDFYADWCKPCKIVAPIMDELAKEYQGKLIVYKINTDKERELAGAFQVSSIPAILFIPKAGQPQMAVGALPKEEYIKAINNLLLPSNQ